MRRRNFLGALLATPVALFAAPQFPSAPVPMQYINVPKIANDFAAEYNTWGHIREATPPTAYSFAARKQWDKKVKPAFHAVDVAVKNE